VILIILDGWGIAPANLGNAIELAKKPTFDFLKENFPYTQLQASGESVGLYPNSPGNSEAGHFNLGAGRIVLDDAVFISQSIENKIFFQNQVLLGAINHVKKNKSHLHLMGLLPETATAHANPEHLIALIKMAEENEINEIFLHIFADGRDSTPRSLLKAYAKIKPYLQKTKIVSLIGRFYAMDRKKDWSKTEIAYNLLVLGKGKKFNTLGEAVSYAYSRSGLRMSLLTDEYIPPSIFLFDGKPVTINDNDAVIFFNLRSDRARQITKAFVQKEFNKKNPGSFKRKKILKNLFFVALTDFGPDLDDIKTAFPARKVKNSLPQVLQNFLQYYIAEKEKYAHITYFFNGGYDQPYFGEKRILVPSPEVECYDQTPEMSAEEVTKLVIEKFKNERPAFIAVNFANPDILGHTGEIKATVKAIEFVDKCLNKIIKEVLPLEATIIVTADHGNAEKMIELETGEIFTGHTTNPVPFILVSKKKKLKLQEGILGDVAPTILQIMEIEKPKEMTGQSLIK
ncbi:MAG: 2,3-bisphosphoglycerate-independent phosphoglycerate mutase, partial [Patescibacteria group bacterium]